MNYKNLIYAAVVMSFVSCGAKKEVVKESETSEKERVSRVDDNASKRTPIQTETTVKEKKQKLVFSVKGVAFEMVRVPGGTYDGRHFGAGKIRRRDGETGAQGDFGWLLHGPDGGDARVVERRDGQQPIQIQG